MFIFKVFILFMLDNHIFDIANCGNGVLANDLNFARSRRLTHASIMDWELSNIQVASLSMQRMTRESLEIIQQSQKANVSIGASLEGCGICASTRHCGSSSS